MRGYYKGFAALFLGAVLGLCQTNAASAATPYLGAWSDNAPERDRIGDLVITSDTLTIKKQATYSISYAGPFNKGEMYKVGKVDRTPDPFGCGPDEKVTYIIINPLPDIPQIKQQAIRIFFYGRTDEAPDENSFEKNPGFCGSHPYGREP